MEFYQTLKENKSFVNVFLVNGIKLYGKIAEYEEKVVFLESNKSVQLIYIHAISTVQPSLNQTGQDTPRKNGDNE
jgi:host factor-I protein